MTEELKKCPSCGKVIYANADVCKYCGAEQKKPKKKHRILKTILTVFAVRWSKRGRQIRKAERA